MDKKQVYNLSSEILNKKGIKEKTGRYIPPSDLGGDYFIIFDKVNYEKKGLVIERCRSYFEDGSGEIEGLRVYEKPLFPFSKKKTVFSKEGEDFIVFESGEWENKLEEIVKDFEKSGKKKK
ncbi:MAG TPA: hypothetical protein VJ912_02910 [Candidatus Nanoarchaeia archaeon]|nr:hypothetical protein [Candidatus Nanoarchaeia archaeon]